MQFMARRRRRTAAPIKMRWFRNFIHLASAIMTLIFEDDRHAIKIISYFRSIREKNGRLGAVDHSLGRGGKTRTAIIYCELNPK